MKKVRLDTLLVDRGLAPSRERARALIMAGQVQAGSGTPLKPGTFVAPDAAGVARRRRIIRTSAAAG